ncbi:Ig-like domain-containing protein [Plantactinospora sp. B5E13]|uniref:Ig-like domain-containing protein n=1 Tax=unclassified Plantactinospora TaxID=2631981 RepID=UPI00325D8F3D
MSSRRLAAVVAVFVAVATSAAAPAAHAALPGDPLYGDFNADGITDLAVLGETAPNLCSTVVEFGRAAGVLAPPVAYTYLRPNGSSDAHCPDVGVALDVDDDPADELWVGWSTGAPVTVSFNRLVLQPPTFVPSAYHTSIIRQPSFVGMGMFDGNGRPSPYDVGPGGVQNFVINGASVVPGPVAFCTVDSPAVIVSDFNQDGIDGTLVTYQRSCADNSSGVLRIRNEGPVAQVLESDPTGATSWDSRVVHANDDRYIDVRTVNRDTGRVSHFINRTVGTETLFIRTPDANTDRVRLASVKALAIDVLANDHATRNVDVVVTQQPRYGSVQVQSDRRIVYRPNPRYGRTDRFSYQLREEGRRSSATVTIQLPG